MVIRYVNTEDSLNPILRIQKIVKNYHKGSIQVQAVQSISFDVSKSEFITIVGRSGSGKSTLLNLVGGLDRATSGHLFVNNADLTKMKRSELALHRRQTVGMIFQSFNLIPSRTALENITLALAFGGMKRRDRKQKASEILSRVGLEHRLDHKPGELSGGEAQRVAIARALANEPDILLADEPTGNLDSKTSIEIIQLLEKLNQKQHVTILMVTHDEELAKTVSHRILHLFDGKIVHQQILRRIS
ncbi:ABC transporter ATP-binding protein [bacterium]|nr:ABC transporter ATP-binding protein [bacterium]